MAEELRSERLYSGRPKDALPGVDPAGGAMAVSPGGLALTGVDTIEGVSAFSWREESMDGNRLREYPLALASAESLGMSRKERTRDLACEGLGEAAGGPRGGRPEGGKRGDPAGAVWERGVPPSW